MITPQDVKSYTTFEAVKNREDSQLQQDIIEAKAEIKRVCGHTFNDTEKYPTLPEDAKLAWIKLAQFFALINSDESITKGITSENLGDYSYTLADGTVLRKPDVFNLLSDYIETRSGTIKFRLGGL